MDLVHHLNQSVEHGELPPCQAVVLRPSLEQAPWYVAGDRWAKAPAVHRAIGREPDPRPPYPEQPRMDLGARREVLLRYAPRDQACPDVSPFEVDAGSLTKFPSAAFMSDAERAVTCPAASQHARESREYC